MNIRALRAALAAVVRRAAAGERIVITVGGQPVAQLGPLEAAPGRGPTLDDLVARGLVMRARRGDRPPPSVTVPLWAGARIDRLLRELRG